MLRRTARASVPKTKRPSGPVLTSGSGFPPAAPAGAAAGPAGDAGVRGHMLDRDGVRERGAK